MLAKQIRSLHTKVGERLSRLALLYLANSILLVPSLALRTPYGPSPSLLLSSSTARSLSYPSKSDQDFKEPGQY
jgi:hypothetical protein